MATNSKDITPLVAESVQTIEAARNEGAHTGQYIGFDCQSHDPD
jgi:hypothetical protein